MAAKNNLQLYLRDDLADRVAIAKEAGTLDPKAVSIAAITAALDGPHPTDPEVYLTADRESAQLGVLAEILQVDPSWQDVVTRVGQVLHALAVAEGHLAATDSALLEIPMTHDGTTFEVVLLADATELVAKVDRVTEDGGWPVSHAADAEGGYSLILAWPSAS